MRVLRFPLNMFHLSIKIINNNNNVVDGICSRNNCDGLIVNLGDQYNQLNFYIIAAVLFNLYTLSKLKNIFNVK